MNIINCILYITDIFGYINLYSTPKYNDDELNPTFCNIKNDNYYHIISNHNLDDIYFFIN